MRVWNKKDCVEVEMITMDCTQNGIFCLYCMDDNAKCYFLSESQVCSLKEHEREQKVSYDIDERLNDKRRFVWDYQTW